MNKKPLTIFLTILLSLSAIVFTYIFIKNSTITKDINSLKKEIQKSTIDKDEISNNKEKLETELQEIKEKQKEKISEYEVWKETNQKLEEIIG